MLRFRDLLPHAEPARAPTNTPVPTNTPRVTRTATNTKSANGRDRAAFNTYQREYMRKRRAAAKEKP